MPYSPSPDYRPRGFHHVLEATPKRDDTGSEQIGQSLPSSVAPYPNQYQEDQGTDELAEEEQPLKPKDKEAVTWSSLPCKTQLVVLTLARLSEPLADRSMAAYIFYQLRWLSPEASEATIASQGGLVTAAFAAAQFVTAVWWGRLADHPRIGRKRVLLVGLVGTFISCLGIGFSKTFGFALFCRIVAGVLNGNAGVMRTMISEIVKEKKYQSRAFLLLPMCFNVGVVIGPMLGGLLADPIKSFPHTFGPGSWLGGDTGVSWMVRYPYALPQLVSGLSILSSAVGVVLFLDETHEARQDKPDVGRRIGKLIARYLFCSKSTEYLPVNDQEGAEVDSMELNESARPSFSSTASPLSLKSVPVQAEAAPAQTVPFFSIFTKNVSLTLLAHFLIAFHASSFNTLIFLLLPAARSTNTEAHLPFAFTGGLGLSTKQVGMAASIIGAIGLPLQILFYPTISDKLGPLRAYRFFLPFSVLAYTLLPYLVLLPDKPGAVWPGLILIFSIQVISRTFALPSAMILINNSAPSRRALGTVHGFAQSIGAGGRSVGPVLCGALLGYGLQNNCVGLVWWFMAGVAGLNWALTWTIYEGDGQGGGRVT